jgi:hypothetical protein
VLEAYAWLLVRKGHPQRALDEVNRYLLASGTSTTYDPAHLPLLLIRARLFAQQKKWHEAERDLDDLFRLSRSTATGAFLDAWLLRGFLREQQGDAEGAHRAWCQGLTLARRLKALHVLSAAIMASLSGEMTTDDAQQMIRGVLGEVGDTPLMLIFKTGLFPMHELAGALKATWRSARGREYARRIAFHDIGYEEMLGVQTILGTLEGCRLGTFGDDVTAEQDALMWKLFCDIFQGQRKGKLKQVQVVQILSAWGGATGLSGWAGLAPQLSPGIRGPLAYVLGHRSLRLKKPKDAEMYFRVALKDAPPDSALRRLAEADLKKLPPK